MLHDFFISGKWVESCQESNTFFLFWSELLIIDGKYTFAQDIESHAVLKFCRNSLSTDLIYKHFMYMNIYIYIYILGFEMALKKIKTEKTKHRKLTWYFNCSAYVELLLHTWFVVLDGRSGGQTASQISTTCIYGSNLKPNQWQLWYIDTPIDNVITWLMRNIHTKSKLVNSMTSAVSFTNPGISPV